MRLAKESVLLHIDDVKGHLGILKSAAYPDVPIDQDSWASGYAAGYEDAAEDLGEEDA